MGFRNISKTKHGFLDVKKTKKHGPKFDNTVNFMWFFTATKQMLSLQSLKQLSRLAAEKINKNELPVFVSSKAFRCKKSTRKRNTSKTKISKTALYQAVIRSRKLYFKAATPLSCSFIAAKTYQLT